MAVDRQPRPPPVNAYKNDKPATIPAPPKLLNNISFPKVPAPDPQRGIEASLNVARGGKLDPRYRPAARRVLAIMIALPVTLVLSWELYQRRFMGKEKRPIPST